MKNLSKYTKHIVAVIFLIAGALCVLIGNNLKVQGGLTCLFWAISTLILIWIGYSKNKLNLEKFDTDANEILQDIATKGAESEYYQFYNIQIINKMRKKFVRRQTKQIASCSILAVILLIIAIVCMI